MSKQKLERIYFYGGLVWSAIIFAGAMYLAGQDPFSSPERGFLIFLGMIVLLWIPANKHSKLQKELGMKVKATKKMKIYLFLGTFLGLLCINFGYRGNGNVIFLYLGVFLLFAGQFLSDREQCNLWRQNQQEKK